MRVFTVPEPDRQPSSDREASTFDGALTDDSAGEVPVTVNRQAPPPLKGGADFTVADTPPTDDLTTEACELVEAGAALGVSSGLILTAIRTHGAGLVRQALAVASKDMASRAGIH